MTHELSRLDAVDQAELVRAGDLSPTELVQATIERIEALNPELNAVIHKMYDKAMAEAISPELGDGPFRGVPMLLKDLWPHSKGDPWHQGVKGLRDADHRATEDSDLVRRYREAGFVILARTNTPELGLMATTEPQAYGPTRNPWNTDHGAGGSSGGASAAVASGMVPAANASDGGGSIRIPAAMCGLVGLKPSRGRVPMGPGQDEWSHSVQHVVSHTVRDTAAILDVSAIPTLGDGVVAPAFGQPYGDTYRQEPPKLRVGVIAHSFRDGFEIEPDVVAATRGAAALVEGLGHNVDDSYPAPFDEPETRALNVSTWPAGTGQAVDRISQWLGRPATADDVEPGTWFMAQQAGTQSGTDVIAAQAGQAQFRRAMSGWWQGGHDILITPTSIRTAPPIGELTPTEDSPMQGSIGSIPYAMFTSLFNSTGQPAISLPLGLDHRGLPIGIQFVAAYGREDLLLQLARQLETELCWSDARAPMHP